MDVGGCVRLFCSVIIILLALVVYISHIPLLFGSLSHIFPCRVCVCFWFFLVVVKTLQLTSLTLLYILQHLGNKYHTHTRAIAFVSSGKIRVRATTPISLLHTVCGHTRIVKELLSLSIFFFSLSLFFSSLCDFCVGRLLIFVSITDLELLCCIHAHPCHWTSALAFVPSLSLFSFRIRFLSIVLLIRLYIWQQQQHKSDD